MRRLAFLLMVILLGCAKAPENVVVILPLSGEIKGYGEDCLKGIQIAHSMSEKLFPLVVVDNKCDLETTIETIKSLPKNTLMIIGPMTSSIALSAANIANMLKIPIFLPSATHNTMTDLPEYAFRLCFTNEEQAKAIAQFVYKELGKKRASIMTTSESPYSSDLAASFSFEFQHLGGEIAGDIHYKSGDKNIRDKLTELKKTKPDVIFVPGYYNDVITIIEETRKMGIKTPIVGGDGWDSDELSSIPENLRGKNYFVTHFSPDRDDPFVQSFVEEYKKRYGNIPSAFAALGFDAYNILTEVTGDGREKIVDGMKKMKGFMGVTGMMYEGGEAEKSPMLIKFSKSGFEYLGIIKTEGDKYTLIK